VRMCWKAPSTLRLDRLAFDMPAVRRSTAQFHVEPCGLSREVVAFGEVGR
jgi:hypothetical protein